MFTTIDKAIAAVIGGIASFFGLQFGFNAEWLTPDLTVTISSLIAGVLTYFVPNKEAV